MIYFSTSINMIISYSNLIKLQREPHHKTTTDFNQVLNYSQLHDYFLLILFVGFL